MDEQGITAQELAEWLSEQFLERELCLKDLYEANPEDRDMRFSGRVVQMSPHPGRHRLNLAVKLFGVEIRELDRLISVEAIELPFRDTVDITELKAGSSKHELWCHVDQLSWERKFMLRFAAI